MRFKVLNFIDPNFGEKTENILIWDNESFILVTTFENKITIKKYEDVMDFLKDYITNKNELEFLREMLENQMKEETK